MKLYEEQRSSRLIHQGKIINLRLDTAELEDGRMASREVVEHSGGVCVVAVNEQQELLLVRQFRYPMRQAILELPAGKVNPGEDHSACGLRELEEETGYTAGIYRPLGCLYPSPAYLTEVIHIYYAADLKPVGQRLDDGEFLEVERLPLQRALELILAGEIPDAKTQVGILKYVMLREKGLL